MSICEDSVICGDNCEVMRQWPDECVDLVVTSPPYDDLRTYGGCEWDFYGVAWNIARTLRQGGVLAWNVADATVDGGETGTSFRQAIHFQKLGLLLHDTMIWHKPNALPLNNNRYEPAWEYVFIFSKGKPATWNPIREKSIDIGKLKGGTQIFRDGSRKQKWGNGKPVNETKVRQNLWQFPVGGGKTGHPAPFPSKMAAMHIQSWSKPGDTVLDPFAGSGTTLKAAKELGRRYVGIEVNPEYVEICRRRIAQEVLPLDNGDNQ